MLPKLKIKIADYILVGAILVWGFVGFWFNIQQASASGQKYAAIYVQNQMQAELSLSTEDRYEYSFTFGENGEHTALVEVEEGRIRMMPLDGDICPKHICSHTGWIEYSYESIVCLPNQIMIVFTDRTAGSGEEGLDGVTF